MRTFPLLLPVCFLAACNADTSWQEEIATAQGQRIVLDRVESRWRFASSSLPGSGSPDSQKLSATIPGLGRVVWEHDHTLSHPVAFDVIGGTPWLILENDVPCEKHATPEPLRIFRYAARKWHQVRIADAPARLEANLVHYPYAESRGNLGRRPHIGKCDADLGKVDSSFFSTPAGTWLRYAPYCGKALPELSRAALRNSRNCAFNNPPANPGFAAEWDAYRQTQFREVAAQTANREAPAPGHPPERKGVRGTEVGYPGRFACAIGCKEDVLENVLQYKNPADDGGPLEFSLAGVGNRRFYASPLSIPGMLVCDQQGFKLLHMDRVSSRTQPYLSQPYLVRAVVFDSAGKLVGKWSVTLPDPQSEPDLYRAGQGSFLYGVELLDSEVRVLVGRGVQNACRGWDTSTVFDLRAPR